MNKLIIILIILVVSVDISAETLKGFVFGDKKNPNLFPVKIENLRTNLITYTADSNYYQLPNTELGDTVLFSSPEFISQSFIIDSTFNLDVNLISNLFTERSRIFDVQSILLNAIEKSIENKNRIESEEGKMHFSYKTWDDSNNGIWSFKYLMNYEMSENIYKSDIEDANIISGKIGLYDKLEWSYFMYDLTKEKLVIHNAHIISPISKKGLEEYQYSEYSVFGDKEPEFIRLKFSPKDIVNPSLKGYIDIDLRKGVILQVLLEKSDYTSFYVLDNIHIRYVYNIDEHDYAYSSYYELRTSFDWNTLLYPDYTEKKKFVVIWNDIKINNQKEDSLSAITPNNIKIKIDDEITSEVLDKLIYLDIDEINFREKFIVKSDTNENNSGFNHFFNRFFRFYNASLFYSLDKVMSNTLIIHYGLSMFRLLDFDFAILPNSGEYDASRFNLKFNLNENMSLAYGRYNWIEKQTYNRDYTRLTNTFASVNTYDYYDYYSKRGYNISLIGDYSKYKYSLEFNNYWASNVENTIEQGLINYNNWFLENRQVSEGRINDFNLSFKYDMHYDEKPMDIEIYRENIPYISYVEFNSKIGANTNGKFFFSGIGDIKITQPVLFTGYNSGNINARFRGGFANINSPEQYLFLASTRHMAFFRDYSFLTLPQGLHGGNEFYQVTLDFDMNDYIWRSLGLPRIYKNRGLSTKVVANIGKFNSNRNQYMGTIGSIIEMGIDIGRIPFFYDFGGFLSIANRWMIIGPNQGQYAIAIGLEYPTIFKSIIDSLD